MSRRKRRNRTRFSLFAFQDIITCVMGIMLLLTLIMCLQITTVTASVRSSAPETTLRQMRQRAGQLEAEIQAAQQSVDQQLTLLQAGALSDSELLQHRSDTLRQDNARARDSLNQLHQQQSDVAAQLQQTQLEAEQSRRRERETAELQGDNSRLRKQLGRLQAGNRVVYNAHIGSSGPCWLVELARTGTFLCAEIGKSGKPLQFLSVDDLRSWILQESRSGAAFLLIVKPDGAAVLDDLSPQLRTQGVTFGFDLLPQNSVAIDPDSGAAAL